ncbi:MAG TPA: VWA domain-containing protein [Pyrinomonadaceae bacterium]|nr:VWA domain-containing protein [Pyrinomonadaceae bacterium]
MFNPTLRDELLKLQARGMKSFGDPLTFGTDISDSDGLRKFREKNTTHLCRILKRFDWPSTALVGRDGQAAAFFLLKNSSSVELQKELLPVMVSLTERGEIDRPSLAGYVDRVRLSVGLKQLFGTEVMVKDGFLVLHPIEAETSVDARRSQYNLRPLAQYLKSLEIIYRMPLIKAPGRRTLARNVAELNSELGLLDSVIEANDVIRVETNLVSLEVSVYSKKQKAQVTNLEQKDFKIFEDGQEETISYFAATQAPFDLILLIDLSGSTEKRRDLVRMSTQHFIEAARPTDRVAIVTFSDVTKVIAPLSNDRSMLLRSMKNIEGTGGSKVWDALKLTLDHVAEPRSLGRRSAVVFMTDGADTRLVGFNRGSETSFADLLEAVRLKGTLIIPIYLDTEGKGALSRRVYEHARKTLRLLAEESGGRFYKARKVEDLNGVYDQVVGDLSKIYSLGYRPANSMRDGSWRTVQIQIPHRTDVVPHTRSGYYAR